MKEFLQNKYKTLLFHLFLWGLWFYLPVSMAPDEEFYSRAFQIAILISCTHIPLFLVNTELLIPRVLEKKGVRSYLWYLLGVMAVVILFHNFLREQIGRDFIHVQPGHGSGIKGAIAITLVAAISTGYGLLNYFARQERIHQEKVQERLQSELSFLRNQISPHFIFNVLNGIVYLIRTKSDLAEPITLKLSEIIRYMLYVNDREEVPLEKELNYLKVYMDLQNVRFGDDVTVHFEQSGDPLDYTIEPMLLIPFVENAFKHGIGMLESPSISVTFAMQGANLSFKVRNKIAPESEAQKASGSGIGLRNVKRRLDLLYPQAHQLTVDAQEGWFEANLKLHLHRPNA
ncbi:MAG: histidine kinase [Bacteroidetes bacterium]|nr:histidine kinase [Bacteroidota bacterium]